MADTNLKKALRRAGMTPEEFADVVRVDPKTVQRWVAGTTMPYPRHRATIARALDLTEHDLWPEHTPPPASGSGRGDRDLAAGSEVTGTWAHDTDQGAPDPITFLSRTDGPIDMLENFRGIQLTPELTQALAERAAAGREIRILTNRPIRRVEPLLGLEHVEIRFVEYLEQSLLRAGDAMLLALILDDGSNQPLPLLQLHRTTDGRLFGRLLDNLDMIAASAEGPLTAPEQLDRYRTNADDEADQDEGDWAEPLQPRAAPTTEPSGRAAPADDSGLPGPEEQSRRRWPRAAN